MERKWSWLKAGAALGILNIIIFVSGNNLGTTTFYAQTMGYLTSFFAPGWIADSAWTAGTCGDSGMLAAGWQWFFVLGIFFGALVANKTAKVKPAKDVIPKMWAGRFGDNPRVRFAAAFIGGFLLLFGARMAGGCTSSQVISGMSQMAVSGIVFGLAVFAAGIPTALLLYRGGKSR